VSEKKKIDMLIWIKGIDEDSEGDVLKDAVGLKKYTDDIVVVAGPPEKLLAPEARRELLENLDDDADEEDEWDDEDWAVIEGDD